MENKEGRKEQKDAERKVGAMGRASSVCIYMRPCTGFRDYL